ncbi:MAG: hypothetical protein APF77_11430 [Clostridia bacterium BRH_c25]|nr:MAG: hypothetical protein APF77_11430 [Clostridia bacterium BRH_c25]
MNNAAIIVFRRSTLPKVLKFFAMPRINQIIEAGDHEDKTMIHIIECPAMRDPADNRKVERSLKSMCLENNISFFIGKNIEYYLGSGLEHIESIMERSSTDEIKAIKDLGALIKLSVNKNVNLLKKNMCFIGESHSYEYISTMAEEAAGVVIYEHDKMDNALKKTVYERLMAEKGISAAFTKNMSRAISQCDIVLVDDSVELEENQAELSGKTLIGSNAASGDFEKVSRVLLWYDSLESLAEDDLYISFNDEILGVLRHFYRERSTMDFIRRFPYIYLT